MYAISHADGAALWYRIASDVFGEPFSLPQFGWNGAADQACIGDTFPLLISPSWPSFHIAMLCPSRAVAQS